MTWDVFSDFVEMSAISLSNAVDLNHREEREKRYLQIVKKYNKEELLKFPELLGMLVGKMEEGPADYLGQLFHDLELHNKYKGQFFTPYPLCKMMAKIIITSPDKIIEEKGFITASEPCCGSGAMIIALADVMREGGINYQQQLHVTAVDLDTRCVHMTYLQLSLMHIPAIIVHGNTLSLEEFAHWYTPAHILDLWNFKLKRGYLIGREPSHEKPSKNKAIEQTAATESHEPAPTIAQPADIQLDLFGNQITQEVA